MANQGPEQTVLSLPADLRALWHVLLEKWWIIALGTVLCGALGFAYASRLPKLYSSTATVQVEPEQQRLVTVEKRTLDAGTDEEVLKTIEQSLLSPDLALRLVNHPEVKSQPGFLPRVKRPASDEQLRRALSSEISVSVRRGTQLIDVTIEDESPAMAQKLARLLVEEFLRGSAEGRAEASQGAHTFLREEADRLKARLAASERKLQAYKEEHRAVSLEEKQNIVVERLKELNAKVTEARAERLKIETDRAQLQGMAGQPPEKLLGLTTIAGAGEVGELRREISEKETELAALSGRYKEEHPKFIQAASELSELRSALEQAIVKAAETLGASFDAAQITEKKLEDALRSQEEIALQLSQIAIPYEALEREVMSDRALYDALLARVKEAEVAGGISQHAVRMVSRPLLADRPSKPNKRLIIALSICAGLALATTLVFATGLLDASLKTVDQAEAALKLRSLGAIPTQRKTGLEEARRLLIEKPQSAVAENFRALRTALHFAASAGDFRTVLFTSAIPGEGKSFCAINFAVVLAQQGFRTLLIDADLRLPSIGRVFLGGKSGAGLSDLLLRQCELDEAVRLTSIENLSILPAGGAVPNPAELVSRTPLNELITNALARFDRVVIDTAPVHAVSETLVLASQAQAVCLVVRAGKTPGEVAKRALLRLRESGANVPGFVLNGVPTRTGGYYYHYHAPGYGRDEVYGASVAVPR